MTNTTAAIRTALLAAKERELRSKIASLDPEHLDRIGLITPEDIEQHIADEMADEAEAMQI